MARKQDDSEGYDSMEVNLDDWDQLNDIYDSNHILDQSVQGSTNLYEIDSDNEVAPNIYDDDHYDSNPDDFKDMAREINVDPFSWKTNIPHPPPYSINQTLKSYGVKTAHEYAVFEKSRSSTEPIDIFTPSAGNTNTWVNDHIINQQSEGDLFDDQLLIDGSYNHMADYNYETPPRRSARLAQLRARQENQERETYYTNYIRQHSQSAYEPVEKKEIDTNMNIINPQYPAVKQHTTTNQYQTMMAARNIDLNKLISEYDIEPLVIKDDTPERKDNLPPPEKIDPNNLPQYILDLLNEHVQEPEQELEPVPDDVPIDDAQIAAQIAKDQQNEWVNKVIIQSEKDKFEKDKFEKEQYGKWISETA